MSERPEHAPGDLAPAAGTYEQLNIFGRPNGIRVDVSYGQPFPRAPVGHLWRSVEVDGEGLLAAAETLIMTPKLIDARTRSSYLLGPLTAA